MSVAPLLQLEAALLRRQMPDLLLRPGMTLAARVSERQGRHGIIVLAGTPLVAELPDGVNPGDKLRLLVEDTRGDRVVMKLVQEQASAPAPPPTVGLPLPDGSHARVTVEEREEGGAGAGEGDGEHASIALTYDSPALGAVGLRLSLAPGGVAVVAEMGPGRPFELAGEAASELRDRLTAVTGRTAEVTVVPRREPLDVYA
jgi:hypothetical protein